MKLQVTIRRLFLLNNQYTVDNILWCCIHTAAEIKRKSLNLCKRNYCCSGPEERLKCTLDAQDGHENRV